MSSVDGVATEEVSGKTNDWESTSHEEARDHTGPGGERRELEVATTNRRGEIYDQR